MIKKFMCKHFHEEDSSNVTIGSLYDGIVNILAQLGFYLLCLVVAFAITLMIITGGFLNSTILDYSMENYKYAIIAVLLTWAALAILFATGYVLYCGYDYSHKIQLFKCERKN